ncbi:hypothetical protein [Endozoicomonas euniceicola]|uniref:Peptidase C58 YopT-type domain-containing protein n=1 Tax=Endozoicomonas euniceicola TaxID=1234143 RepID=A0ABY6GR45_9GAMM|nr:hypothetical protein [Endozoicomonas euniceicola]UYM14563.1 hypothetical protein NX720_16915 [Endozoicomonas euniceicola]
MYKKVLNTTSYSYSVNTLWNKKNLCPAVKFEKAGICSGLVVAWIKKSLASKGKGVLSADELDTMSASIIQATYNWKHLFPSKSMGYGAGIPFLLQSQNLISVDDAVGEMACAIPWIYEWISINTGHFILVFFNKAGDDSVWNGHTAGFRYEDKAFEIFEPNTGLFNYSDIPTFTTFVTRYLEEMYEYYDGKWYLHKVELYS